MIKYKSEETQLKDINYWFNRAKQDILRELEPKGIITRSVKDNYYIEEIDKLQLELAELKKHFQARG